LIVRASDENLIQKVCNVSLRDERGIVQWSWGCIERKLFMTVLAAQESKC